MADKNDLDLPVAFEQLLRDELSVEPSPAFMAQVRARVGDEARRRRWWQARLISAFGFCTALASLAVASFVPAPVRWTTPPMPPSPPAVHILAVHSPPRIPLLPSAVSASAYREVPPAGGVRALSAGLYDGTPPSILEQTIIVDQRQRAALRTLFTMMEQGRVSGHSFRATVPVSLEPIADGLGEITVTPLVVSALPPGGVMHNDNER